MSETIEHDEDGAAEVVNLRPSRRERSTPSLEAVARSDAGGRMAQMRAKGAGHRRDFLIHRSALESVKIVLAHEPVFAALWRVWSAKRVQADQDPGATVGEIAQAMDRPQHEVRSVLASLLRNHVIRSTVAYVGRRGARARYYPSEAGVQAFALAEVLGPGSFVQVGRNTTAWRARNRSEPSDLFQHARLLRGGAGAPALEPEFA